MGYYLKTAVLPILAGVCVFVAVILTGPSGTAGPGGTRFAVASIAMTCTTWPLAWLLGRKGKP